MQSDDWFVDDPGPSKPKLDTDRDIDHRDYLRQHLKIFKDEYREMAHESEQSSTQLGFNDGFRRCSKLSIQLGRAHGALRALKSKDSNELVMKIDSILDRIRNVKGKRSRTGDEFDMVFARESLPKYDTDDIDLFLGHNQSTDQRINTEMSEADQSINMERDQADHLINTQMNQTDQAFSRKLNQNTDKLTNAKMIASKYEQDQFRELTEIEKEIDVILENVCDLLHAHGICDGFIY